MGIKSDNVIPHLLMRENFRSQTDVINNGLSVVGAPTINNGISGFSAANYVTLPSRTVQLDKVKYSFSIDITLPSTFQTTTTMILYGGANWNLQASSATNIITFNYNVAGGAQSVALDVTSLMNTRVRISVAVYKSGANIVCDMFVNSLNTTASDAGKMTNLPTYIYVGSDTGANYYNSTIHEIMYYNNYNLTQKDHLKIYNNLFSKDLLPEYSSLFLPCNTTYNNGTYQVTPVIDDVITEAILGNGVTPTTWPTLIGNRLFSFDGNDYIDCGDYDSFTFSLSEPFSCGALVSVSKASVGATFPIIGKLSSVGAGGGEWLLYRNKSDFSIRMTFIDHVAGGYRIIYTPSVALDNILYHVVMTYDGNGSITTSSVKIYVDGSIMSTTLAPSGTFNTIYNTDRKVLIGALHGPVSYGTGLIGMPFIIPHELSYLQIKTMYKLYKLWSYT